MASVELGRLTGVSEDDMEAVLKLKISESVVQNSVLPSGQLLRNVGSLIITGEVYVCHHHGMVTLKSWFSVVIGQGKHLLTLNLTHRKTKYLCQKSYSRDVPTRDVWREYMFR